MGLSRVVSSSRSMPVIARSEPDGEGSRAEPRPAAEAERDESEERVGQPPREPGPEIDHAERPRPDRDRERGRDGAHREPPGIRDEHQPDGDAGYPKPRPGKRRIGGRGNRHGPDEEQREADVVEPRWDLDDERERAGPMPPTTPSRPARRARREGPSASGIAIVALAAVMAELYRVTDIVSSDIRRPWKRSARLSPGPTSLVGHGAYG